MKRREQRAKIKYIHISQFGVTKSQQILFRKKEQDSLLVRPPVRDHFEKFILSFNNKVNGKHCNTWRKGKVIKIRLEIKEL